MNSFLELNLKLLVLQLRKIDPNVHRCSFNTRPRGQRSNPGIRNRSGIPIVRHLRKQLIRFRRCLHYFKWNLGCMFCRRLNGRRARGFFFRRILGQRKRVHHLVEGGRVLIDKRQPFVFELLRLNRPTAEMFELMIERSSSAGYEQYEISNFALPGFESRHNSKYWRLETVFGFGVSAHSFDGFQRYANERDTAKYVEQIEATGSAEVMRETIDLVSESAFLGLRMTRGIDPADLTTRFGHDVTEKYARELDELVAAGLVALSSGNLRLTPKGMLYSNEVFRVFV